MKAETRNPNDSNNTNLQPAIRSGLERGSSQNTISQQGSIKYTCSNLAVCKIAVSDPVQCSSHFPNDSSPAGAWVSSLSHFTAGRMEQRAR